ncbi:MAG: hypothetical protein LBS67_04085, partial [Clostridiales Family XIII bacterium]|nr:hypothetical protein [Clostridiales Family XIII bacterium]
MKKIMDNILEANVKRSISILVSGLLIISLAAPAEALAVTDGAVAGAGENPTMTDGALLSTDGAFAATHSALGETDAAAYASGAPRKTGSGVSTHANTDWYYGHEADIAYTLRNNEDMQGLAGIVNAGIADFKNKTIILGGSLNGLV